MNSQDAEEYTQALGQIGSGWWRQIALGQRLGVPAALGLSTDEWVTNRLGGYIRLSIPDRREAARELTAPVAGGGQGLSQREAAAVLGVARSTVGDDLRTGQNRPPVVTADPPSLEDTGQNRPPVESVCEDCGTPTLPLWVNPEDEAFGVLLCGRCVERRDAATKRATPEPNVVDPAVEFFREKVDELERQEATSWQVWRAVLAVSGFREVAPSDFITALPADRLEYVEPVASAVISWLTEVIAAATVRQSRQPVALGAERIMRGRDNGWLNLAP